MREIRFRAWFKGIDAMGNVVTLNGSNRNEYKGNMWDSVTAECYINGRQQFYTSYNFELMAFTGLHDKNGKEIFEGDVVKVISGGSDHWTREIFTVYYSEDTASFKITNKKSYPHDIDDQISYKYLEVIGNIHENPELL